MSMEICTKMVLTSCRHGLRCALIAIVTGMLLFYLLILVILVFFNLQKVSAF
jgi:hypothetical protein